MHSRSAFDLDCNPVIPECGFECPIDVLKGQPLFYEGFFIPTLITNAEEQNRWPFRTKLWIMLLTSLRHVIL